MGRDDTVHVGHWSAYPKSSVMTIIVQVSGKLQRTAAIWTSRVLAAIADENVQNYKTINQSKDSLCLGKLAISWFKNPFRFVFYFSLQL